MFRRTAKAFARESEGRAGYRFYAMYDKISREDVLVHAYAQCRSNEGAPGVDRQEFADIEAYGVQRWLGELALALRQETYRPRPIRRSSCRKPTANSGRWASRPCQGSVCMTAAMLVLKLDLSKPTFHQSSMPTAPGETPNGGGRGGRVALHRGHPEVVDADLADYFGSIPHARASKVGNAPDC